MRTCFFAGWPGAGPCDGRLVRAHLIRRQVIRRELAVPAGRGADVRAWLDWDPRVWVWCCGGPLGNAGHHGALDVSRTLRIPRERLPAGVEEFAVEHGLDWWLDRTYGPRGQA